MYLYGASGHAKVIIDLLESKGITVDGLIDDNPAIDSLLGYRVEHTFHGQSPLILSIGSNRIRKILDHRLQTAWGRAIHPAAIVSPRATVGEGSVIMAGAILQVDVMVGRHCIINTGTSVDHECEIGDYVHLSPHATLCGNVHVGEGTWIGAGATIIQGVKIGRWCTIGAGSVVTKDVPDATLYVSNRDHLARRYYAKLLEEMDNLK